MIKPIFIARHAGRGSASPLRKPTAYRASGGFAVMLILLLVGCAPSADETSAPPAEASVTASAAADEVSTGTVEPRKITIEDFKATQNAAIEGNQATQAAITPTPTSAAVTEGEPTIIDTTAADILNAGVLPDGAVAQIPAVAQPSSDELAALGERYAVISDGRSMRVYEVAGGSLAWAVRFGDDADVKHSPDERWIVATIGEKHYVWETATGRLTNTIQGAYWFAGITSWSTDSMLLVGRGDGEDYQLRDHALINPATNDVIYTITDQKQEIGHVLWTSDGRFLITANWAHGQGSNELVVRDPTTGRRLRAMNDPLEWGDSVASLHLSPDEATLAATYGHWGGDTSFIPGKTVIWSVETGERIHDLDYPSMTDTRFSPDGSKIAVAGMSYGFDEPTAVMAIWDTASGELLHEITYPEPADPWWLEDAEWSPNGALIAAVTGERIVLFDALRGEYIRTLEGTADRVEWSRDGEKVRSSVHEWNLVTGGITRLDGAPITGMGPLVDLAWLPDGTGVVIASKQAVQVWAVDPSVDGGAYYLRSMRLAELEVTTNRFEGINAIAISPDGRTLATAQADAIALWDVASGSLRRVLSGSAEGEQSGAIDIAWSPDGKWIAAAGGSTRVWDASGDLSFEVPELSRVVSFSPDSSRMAVASQKFLTVFNLNNQQRVALHDQVYPSIKDANFLLWTLDGTGIAIGSGSRDSAPNVVTIWGMETGCQIVTQGHPYPITGLAWLPDPRYLLSSGGEELGGDDFYTNVGAGSLILWDTQTAQPVRIFYGHTDEVQAVAVSPDGALFASASADGTVLIWDVP